MGEEGRGEGERVPPGVAVAVEIDGLAIVRDKDEHGATRSGGDSLTLVAFQTETQCLERVRNRGGGEVLRQRLSRCKSIQRMAGAGGGCRPFAVGTWCVHESCKSCAYPPVSQKCVCCEVCGEQSAAPLAMGGARGGCATV